MSANPIERAARRIMLASLARGPAGVAEMPRAWPVTRTVLRAVARRIMAEGLVEELPGLLPRLRLTKRGERAVARLVADAA